MLETINALKNNNIRKIAQYDPTVMEEGNKIISVVVKGRGNLHTISPLVYAVYRYYCTPVFVSGTDCWRFYTA